MLGPAGTSRSHSHILVPWERAGTQAWEASHPRIQNYKKKRKIVLPLTFQVLGPI